MPGTAKTAKAAKPAKPAKPAKGCGCGCGWTEYDPATAPLNRQIFVADKKTGARAVVVIRGKDGPCTVHGKLDWVPTHVCIPPAELP